MKRDIIKILDDHNSFEDNVIQSISFEKEGYIIQVLIVDPSRKKHVISFECVSDFNISRHWNNAQQEHPSMINWSSSEIALLEFENNSLMLAQHYKHNSSTQTDRFYHVSFKWEGPDRIDVVFKKMIVKPVEEKTAHNKS